MYIKSLEVFVGEILKSVKSHGLNLGRMTKRESFRKVGICLSTFEIIIRIT